MKPDRHEFFVVVDEYGTQLAVTCPYDRADQSRPCWPHHEDGDGEFTFPDDPPQTMCTYEDNIDNADITETLHGQFTMPLAPVRVEWTDGYLALHKETP